MAEEAEGNVREERKGYELETERRVIEDEDETLYEVVESIRSSTEEIRAVED